MNDSQESDIIQVYKCINIKQFIDMENIKSEGISIPEETSSKTAGSNAFRLGLTLATASSLLSGACVNRSNNIEKDSTPTVALTEPVNINTGYSDIDPTSTTTPTPLPSPEIPTPTEEVSTVETTPTITQEDFSKIDFPSNISVERNEAFDFESINFLNWSDFELLKDEVLEKPITIETKFDENYLYVMPTVYSGAGLGHEWVNKLKMPQGYKFNIRQKKLVSNSKGEVVTLGVVDNSFSQEGYNSKLVVLLNGIDSEGESQGFVTETDAEEKTITFIGTGEWQVADYFVKGGLLSLYRISQNQVERGGLPGGTEISLHDVLKPLESFTHYDKIGYKPNKPYVVGSECLTSSISRLSQLEGSNIEIINSSSNLPIVLWPGESMMDNFDWIKAVGIEETEDFVFKIGDDKEKKYYFKIQPIMANLDPEKLDLGLSITEKEKIYTASRIVYGATISLVEYPVDGQSAMLNTLYNNYHYYVANKGSIPMDIPQGFEMEKYLLNENNLTELLGKNKPFPFIDRNEMEKYLIQFVESQGGK